MLTNEILTIYSEDATKSNAEIIDETYYEYHGKYDDGYSPVDDLRFEGVIVA